MGDIGFTVPRPSIRWQLGDQFNTPMPHHASMRALWETKWRTPAKLSVYPFHDGIYNSFQKIFHSLIAQDINDGYSDEYTYAFFPEAQRLAQLAEDTWKNGDEEEGKRLALAACSVYRIARFPYMDIRDKERVGIKWEAYRRQKSLYLKAASRWTIPVQEVMLPIVTKDGTALPGEIPSYVRLSKEATQGKPGPTMILFTGLDGHRPDNTTRLDEFHSRGWSAIVLDIPGTADCPFDAGDPTSTEQLLDSVFTYLHQQVWCDKKRVVMWGLSAGGYHAARGAHTHARYLAGSVAQGAGVHYQFSSDWADASEVREYPFPLLRAMSIKFGYSSIEDYKRDSQAKFSLLSTGILDMESCRLLMINGTMDGLMPIEDSWLCFEHGRAKEGKFIRDRLHMGYPEANRSVYPWLEDVVRCVE